MDSNEPRARQAKSKARVSAYEKLLAEDRPDKIDEVEIYIPAGPRLGGLVFEANKITKSFGDKVLFEDLSFNIPPGSLVGIIGGNGVGKTTLFRMLTGQEKPDHGTIRIGETVKLAYVDQSRDVLDPNRPYGKKFLTGRTRRFSWGTAKCNRELTVPVSILPEETSKRRWESFPVEREIAFIWQRF